VVEPIPFPDPLLGGAGFVLRPYRAGRCLAVRRGGRGSVDLTLAQLLRERRSGSRSAARRRTARGRQAARADDCRLRARPVSRNDRPGRARGGHGRARIPRRPRGARASLANRAVGALGDWAIAELGMRRLQLRIDPENDASHAVARRAGYQREGLPRSSFVLGGERKDTVMYSRLPTDPAATAAAVAAAERGSNRSENGSFRPTLRRPCPATREIGAWHHFGLPAGVTFRPQGCAQRRSSSGFAVLRVGCPSGARHRYT
jgi:hypothetical protein